MRKEKERFVPLEKQSKKKQRAANRARRKSWDIYPVTRVVPSKKQRLLLKATAERNKDYE
ncbi:MAG: hypothetical protein IKA41_01680 [Bacteroidaceae bacterium]|nr:hypothetical protein [Bacteroidaceae bacterium]